MSGANLCLGIVTDVHFGPAAYFGGKLRKLTHRAEELLAGVVGELATEIRPDAIVNLGDDIEDESYQADLARYTRCQEILRRGGAPVINVAGNHDTVHLGREELMRVWGERGPLYRSLDLGGVHIVVLHSLERKDVDVSIGAEQLTWLEEDLARTPLPVLVLVHHPLSEQDFDDSRWFSRAPHLALVKNRAEVRDVLRESGKVRLVINGHVHRNHFDVVDGLPFVTVQSLVENLDDDAPGRPAASYAVVRLDDERVTVRVRGNDPARYQVNFARLTPFRGASPGDPWRLAKRRRRGLRERSCRRSSRALSRLPMDLDLTEEQRMLQQTARDFALREVAPKAAELDKSARWPDELVKRMAELGFLGVMVPTEYGGSGLDTVSYVLAMEEISAACASTGVIMSVNNSLFCDPVYKFGTEEQKKEILTPVASGEKLGCFGLTEPMSGSDAQTMVTIAEQQGDGSFILNGAKNWITNGPHADYVIVFAVSEKDPSGKVKHTALLVPKDAQGFSAAPRDHKLGIHAAHSCTLFFENVRVPKEMVVGPVGAGFKVAMSTLDGGRIGIAAQALGIARAALEKSIAYAKERKSFGKPIAEHQAIQFMLSDMATDLDAARLLTLRAASMKDKGVRHSMESAQAKLFASETATRVAHKAIQIHGGYGYSTEYPVERHYRDARITEIYEGTSEIQRIVIAANLLKE